MADYSVSRFDSFDDDQVSSQASLLSEKTAYVNVSQSNSFLTPRFLSDFTIGLSDGLTVPFALTAGLSVLGNGKIVVSAGLAELVAGAFSMGIAGYLAANGERDAQLNSLQSTRRMITAEPEEALATVMARFRQLHLPDEILQLIMNHYSNIPPEKLLRTLFQFEQTDSETQIPPPWLSGITIALAYLFGGFVPLLPYMFFAVHSAFTVSIFITAIVLFTFGCVKVPLSGSGRRLRTCLRSGFEMLILGGLAAVAALLCVKGLNQYREP